MLYECSIRTPPPHLAVKQSGRVQHPCIQTLNDIGLNVGSCWPVCECRDVASYGGCYTLKDEDGKNNSNLSCILNSV